MIESGMNPNAVSSAKAVGLWQFMRATGEMYDLNGKSSIFIDERRDPEKATRAAMRHLRDLYNEFGDWHLAMAAYNCGAGCVSRAIKRTNSDTLDYWKVREKLPGETRAYVPKFISAAKLALDPESYGFKIDSLKFHEKYEYDLYSLNEPVNLDAIAKAANTTVDEIKDLNPELLFNCTPPDRLPYKIKIPKNSLNLFSTNYANLAPEEKEPFLTHIVKNKESIASIAKRYSIRANDLARINNVASTKSRLKKGQELRIPVTISEPEIATETPTETTKPANQRLVNTERFSKHKVLNGETLFNIANMYGMDVARLRKINDLNYGDKILAGQSLYVEGEFQTKSNDMVREVPTEKLKKDAVIYHKVKKGETLAQIADDYNVKINDLRKWNKIKNSKVLKGQKLKILSNNNM